MTPPLLRIAFIGAGVMANRVHYASLAAFPDAQIVAACDLDASRLNETADRWNIGGRYTDYRQMLDACAPLDAVYAVGQPHLMYDVWMDCLQRGLNLHQARALAHVAAKNGCVTQVGFQRRACPLAVRLRDACWERGGPICPRRLHVLQVRAKQAVSGRATICSTTASTPLTRCAGPAAARSWASKASPGTSAYPT